MMDPTRRSAVQRARRALSQRLLPLVLAVLVGSCTSLEKDPTAKWDADRLYNEARTELQAGAWTKARELYEKLEARYPFGRYAQQAQIEIAYCYYKEGETAEAISATDRFLKLNPNSPNADYVYYLRGLINFIDAPALIGPTCNAPPASIHRIEPPPAPTSARSIAGTLSV
jgi:outer membrane protein assembly factor BamD